MTGGLAPRVKGQLWMLACRKSLAALGVPCRAPQAGEAGDDIILTVGTNPVRFSVECKNQTRDALPAWVSQAVLQAGADKVGIVWHKRRGKADPLEGYVTMRARDFWERVA